ncbi:polysaccharide deacetylase family protein [Streptosporangium nondiastaticum]|uniref:Polysaccharide deacetylase family protein n=1 Tax=Streptosporangium nondiastaticum TaxID=35764 RepID=A0A9X7PIP9_9ACTN|nr:polysaccharide deacetylase family protein [Streptosporangium nondiastaticum]PSJ29318.1 polysaccharide deacetylase family protein [Streptosporangium nondiastaticum]
MRPLTGSSSVSFRALLITLLLAFALAPLPSRAATPSPVSDLFGKEVRLLPAERPVVALTFNAAWDEAGIADVVEVLRREGVPAAFFPTGEFAERHPEAVRALAAQGFGLGNHSYSHPHFERLGPGEAAAEVLRADRAIRVAAHTEPLPFFRFPYSEAPPEKIALVNSMGFADLEFTADTKGYLGASRGMTVDEAVRRALDALRPGAVIQMHVGSDDGGPVLDALALPRIVEGARARGYGFADLRAYAGRAYAGRPCPFIRSGQLPHPVPYSAYSHVTLCA